MTNQVHAHTERFQSGTARRSLRDPLELILADIAEAIDVPPSAHQQATERYEAVGTWLHNESSGLHLYNPQVYPQGSFSLGTAVLPVGGDDYDIDAVIQLEGDWAPGQLKAAVGNGLRQSKTYARLLEDEGRRCWTLKYASETKRHGFHLDLLPSTSASSIDVQLFAAGSSNTALAITNKTNAGYEWRASDPKAYANWFEERCVPKTTERVSMVAGVEPVREFDKRQPLQQVIQLLKRYRDVLFQGADEHAPISVIITTLAAQAYEGEDSLVDTLFGVVGRMSQFIEVNGNTVRIPNPVQPGENFADRWQGDARKARAFLRWLEAAKRLEDDLRAVDPSQLGPTLERLLGEKSSSQVLVKLAERERSAAIHLTNDTSIPQQAPQVRMGGRGSLGSVSALLSEMTHRQPPPWTVSRDGSQVSVRGHVTGGRGLRHGELSSGETLLPGGSLRFDATILGAGDAELYWQVTNSGAEARANRSLRGGFERAARGSKSKTEATAYVGDHTIEAFVVRNNICIARSGVFVVSIRRYS